MNLFKSDLERKVITTVKYLPAVSIIMPFTPVVTLKKNLDYHLKNVMSKVEAMLASHYTAEKAIPVIIKLKNLFSNLNYYTHKKSIAIFVSPVVEKVFYFEVEMKEQIVIDPSFKISDLVYCKKEKKEYLLLLLSDGFSKMYLSNGAQLKLIKSNTVVNDQHQENNTSEKKVEFSVDADQTKIVTNKFLSQMDQGLSIILNSCPLPVFVMGCQKVLKLFKKITKNDENIIQFIHGSYENASIAELRFVMDHVVSRWEKLKQQHLLKQVENARTRNKLSIGINETLKVARQNKGRLLIVERKLVSHTHTPETDKSSLKIDSGGNEVFFIKNDLDNIVKKIFEIGGNVEIIDDGLLKNYKNIALIED